MIDIKSSVYFSLVLFIFFLNKFRLCLYTHRRIKRKRKKKKLKINRAVLPTKQQRKKTLLCWTLYFVSTVTLFIVTVVNFTAAMRRLRGVRIVRMKINFFYVITNRLHEWRPGR